MKNNCELIKDLLPLYHDNVCSDVSKKIVEEHLEECTECKKLAEQLQNTDFERILTHEKDGVLQHHAKHVRKKTFVVGSCMAALLSIPIIVCLICNIATGHALDWFFIVLASLMIFASITVVPLMAEEKKGLWTILSFTSSLTLLLLVCCIYTGGTWFFATMIPILFGICLLFLPYILYSIKLTQCLTNKKGLLTMTIDTLLLYSIVIVDGLYSDSIINWGKPLLLTTICCSFPWLLFLIIRYLKTNGFIKAGICTIFTGIFLCFIDDMITLILDKALHCTLLNTNLLTWTQATIEANICFITLLTCTILGAIFLFIGLKKNKNSVDK